MTYKYDPTRYALGQNYPNPFTPSTTIGFELPGSSDVRLSVYDMLGRTVAVLLNELREAGIHQVTFDGSSLASGACIYRMQAKSSAEGGTRGCVQERRLLLLKGVSRTRSVLTVDQR